MDMHAYEEAKNRHLALTFSQTSATLALCHEKAKDLCGGQVEPLRYQNKSSYLVHAGPKLEFTVGFFLDSVEISPHAIVQAGRTPPSRFAAALSARGRVGAEDGKGMRVYLWKRVHGVSYGEFLYGIPSSNAPWVFVHLCHSATVLIPGAELETRRQDFNTRLQALPAYLDLMFPGAIEECIRSIDSIFSIGMIMFPVDELILNIMADPVTCHVNGIANWASGRPYPFGMYFHIIYWLCGDGRAMQGWGTFNDQEHKWNSFWVSFQAKLGVMPKDIMENVVSAMLAGAIIDYHGTTMLLNTPRLPQGVYECADHKQTHTARFIHLVLHLKQTI
ncbi:hypothetical protein AJ80_07199 [Polytolypa hystricis UAMH7299]|uniref:Uncharacterized protein n=1 Tax=Polytolypa hystricis (strain UAMH7299) TaxID=1447883 RepID=A0A2B7XQR5_POLH7|nr:hypothetical protein AJ80_07199 [Polytolypa hystricis UAMH7299]